VSGDNGEGAERREAPPALGLPCLSSNNSNDTTLAIPPGNEGQDSAIRGLLNEDVDVEEVLPKINRLTGSHKRSAFCLAAEIINMANQFGLERLGFDATQ
jgi:hypothetical protein